MRRPRPAAALETFDDGRPGVPQPVRRRRRRKKETDENALIPVRLVLEKKHTDFLENLRLARFKLGPHRKESEIIRALIEAVADADVDLSHAKNTNEVRDTLVDTLRTGMAIEQDKLVRCLSPEAREAVEKHADRIGRSLPELVGSAVRHCLDDVWEPPRAETGPRHGNPQRLENRKWARRRGEKWYRKDTAFWKIEYDASHGLFPTAYEQTIELEQWEIERKAARLYVSDRGDLQCEWHFLIRCDALRVALVREKHGSANRSSMYADQRYDLNIDRLRQLLRELRTATPWDLDPVNKRMCPFTGAATVYLPEVVAGPGDRHAQRNRILKRLARFGVCVQALTYRPAEIAGKDLGARLSIRQTQ